MGLTEFFKNADIKTRFTQAGNAAKQAAIGAIIVCAAMSGAAHAAHPDKQKSRHNHYSQTSQIQEDAPEVTQSPLSVLEEDDALGGWRKWEDHFVLGDWRIQRNIETKQFHIVNPDRDIVAEAENYDAAKQIFDQIKEQQNIEPSSKHALVIIHGISGVDDTFPAMFENMKEDGFEPVVINYATKRRSVMDQGKHLRDVFDRLEGYDKVSFMAHSFGALPLRASLSLDGEWKDKMEIGRAVIVAGLNQGATLASMFSFMPNFEPTMKKIVGELAMDIQPDNARNIPMPNDIEIGTITAGTCHPFGKMPLLLGRNDGVVTFNNQQLPGAEDTIFLPFQHSAILAEPVAQKAAVTFFKEGSFGPDNRNVCDLSPKTRMAALQANKNIGAHRK